MPPASDMPLTDIACRNATCPEGKAFKRYADSGGLYLEVTKSGSKLWRLKYRFDGKEKRLALGAYPEVPLQTKAAKGQGADSAGHVKGARELRDEARALLRAGTDPSEARQDQRRARASASETSFEKVARKWWDGWRSNKTPRYATYVIERLEADAFPEIGSKPVAELAAPHFVRVGRRIEEREASELARRVMATCGQVMRWAVAHGYCDRNPVADVKPADVLKPRTVTNFARLETADLPELMRKITAYDGSVFTRLGMQLMAFTFVRTSELIGASWKEFDLEAAEWRIPPERTKRRRLHVVPLSRQALEVLDCLQLRQGKDRAVGDALLFPGERDRKKPMSNNTILFALYRMGYRGRMTGHGFRGVASTALNEMGFRADVIEAQLAHIEGNKTRAAYNHALYLAERREMMQVWADYLDALRTTGKVVPFRRGRVAAAA